MECHYLDFDGEVFGEVSIQLVIPEFRGTKRINILEAFPLHHHSDKCTMKAHLVECGRKFASLMGTHHRHCRGKAFFMYEGKPVQVSVNCRVMIDAALFRKINPNYARPRVIEPAGTEVVGLCHFGSATAVNDLAYDQVRSSGVELSKMSEDDWAICCPTVPGFSFGDKIWGEI
jgi:hypothetical protein